MTNTDTTQNNKNARITNITNEETPVDNFEDVELGDAEIDNKTTKAPTPAAPASIIVSNLTKHVQESVRKVLPLLDTDGDGAMSKQKHTKKVITRIYAGSVVAFILLVMFGIYISTTSPAANVNSNLSNKDNVVDNKISNDYNGEITFTPVNSPTISPATTSPAANANSNFSNKGIVIDNKINYDYNGVVQESLENDFDFPDSSSDFDLPENTDDIAPSPGDITAMINSLADSGMGHAAASLSWLFTNGDDNFFEGNTEASLP